MTMPNAHRLDLSDPALRQSLGLRESSALPTVTRPSVWWRQPKQDHRERADTIQAILTVLRAAPAPMSRRQIRTAIDRRDSPYFRDVIAEMVSRKLIVERESWYRHLPMFVYEVA